jgi:phosphate transport system substrate-binding protein
MPAVVPAWIRRCAVAGVVICTASYAAVASDDGILRIGGTGMALAAMQQLGERLSAADPTVRVEVLPSLGTPDGLNALAGHAIDVAVTGRKLTAQEQARGAVEAICVTTALGFVSSRAAPPGIDMADLPGLFAGPAPVWPDGMPLKLILRSHAGSENQYLTAARPAMKAALDKAYSHPEVPIAMTDQDNAALAQQIANSFAVMTLLQVRAEHLDLRMVALDGVPPTTETLANKSYPLPIQACVVIPAVPTAAAEKFVAYLRSGPARALMQDFGVIPSR